MVEIRVFLLCCIWFVQKMDWSDVVFAFQEFREYEIMKYFLMRTRKAIVSKLYIFLASSFLRKIQWSSGLSNAWYSRPDSMLSPPGWVFSILKKYFKLKQTNKLAEQSRETKKKEKLALISRYREWSWTDKWQNLTYTFTFLHPAWVHFHFLHPAWTSAISSLPPLLLSIPCLKRQFLSFCLRSFGLSLNLNPIQV